MDFFKTWTFRGEHRWFLRKNESQDLRMGTKISPLNPNTFSTFETTFHGLQGLQANDRTRTGRSVKYSIYTWLKELEVNVNHARTEVVQNSKDIIMCFTAWMKSLLTGATPFFSGLSGKLAAAMAATWVPWAANWNKFQQDHELVFGLSSFISRLNYAFHWRETNKMSLLDIPQISSTFPSS